MAFKREEVARDPIKCGTCGETHVELFNSLLQGEEKQGDRMTCIVALCTGCAGETYIVPEPVQLQLRHENTQTGQLCGNWHDPTRTAMCVLCPLDKRLPKGHPPAQYCPGVKR